MVFQILMQKRNDLDFVVFIEQRDVNTKDEYERFIREVMYNDPPRDGFMFEPLREGFMWCVCDSESRYFVSEVRNAC